MSATAAVPAAESLYARHVNPQWVRLLRLLQMDVTYESCAGSQLFTSDGRCVLDFLSGYCVHNAGHNHPGIVKALQEELGRNGPAMLQSHVPESAGELAKRLTARAGGRLERAFFCSSGSEGVETAIKFSRAHTGRAGILFAKGAFHGLTCGALSLMSDSFWSEGFGPMLPATEGIPFGDLESLEKKLASRKFAAFIVEPVQAEAGIRVPGPDYLKAAEAICRRYGSLLAVDEVQTGIYRTGGFLAVHEFGVEPDIVILAKALSGGLIPVGAVLTSKVVSDSVYSSLRRAIVHTSTFGENGLAMRAGLATLEVMENERLGPRAATAWRAPAAAVERSAGAIRNGEGQSAEWGCYAESNSASPRQLALRIPFEAFQRIHPAMFGQVLVMRLFRDHGILTQICGNHFLVLKAAPPLTVTESQLETFVKAVREVVDLAHHSTQFWSEALGLARRAANI